MLEELEIKKKIVRMFEKNEVIITVVNEIKNKGSQYVLF